MQNYNLKFKIFKNTKIQILLIALITIFAYSNIFQNGFVIDDRTFVTDWDLIKNLSNFPQFFSSNAYPPGHEGVYRPLRTLAYSVYYQIFGINTFGWHLHSILVHLASTILVYFIARQLTSKVKKIGLHLRGGEYLPFITALLFGLHPIHTETITYLASSMDAVGMMLLFLSFYLYLRSQLTSKVKKMGLHLRGVFLTGSVICAFAAYFTNETTLVLPLLIILYDLCFRKIVNRKSLIVNRLNMYLPYFFGVFIYLGIRFLVLDITNRGPYLADSVYLTILTMTKAFVKYLTLLFWPINQANNHTIWGGIEAFVYRGYNKDVIKVQSLLNADILISILILLIILLVAIKTYKKAPLITFGIGWFFIPLLPVSEIIPQGSMLGERFLYIPSFGFCLLLGYLFAKIFNSNFKLKIKNYILVTGLLLLITFYSYQTYQRNKDWQDDITLWSKDIQVYPQTNAYAYFQLGNAYRAQPCKTSSLRYKPSGSKTCEAKTIDLSLSNYQKAFDINPHFAVAIASKALVYQALGKLDEAIPYYQQATTVDPAFWEGYYQLYRIYTIQGKQDLAQIEYQKLLNIYPK